ncbi:hypothetical protein [uncultured Desulfuromonas sp.]|uniref:hypothetical protein n=1 Tax=uncultured Desulfuromonas sp. TaxID=181013 RepID=UPI002AAC1800|nr:hypothetical protein [uncultured Desulfuromonas sp.]
MNQIIRPDMTLLDIVSAHEQTIEIFHRYDEQAGVCLCCTVLFETVEAVASAYQLDLAALLTDLNHAAVSLTDC